MTHTTQPLLDAQALNENTMSNRALQEELFQIFFDQTAHYLDMLRESVKTREIEGWMGAAHGLKGAALALGLTRLARLSSQAELAPPCAETAETIARTLDDSREAARLYLRDAAA